MDKPTSQSPEFPGDADSAPSAAGDKIPPAPAAPPLPADGEISLEEHEDRQQQRPRLPDQRREKKSFEMGTPIAPARESSEPEPAAAPRPVGSAASSAEAEQTPADEIETYDPHSSESAAAGSAGVATRQKPAPKPAVEIPATPGLDDLEEFIARTATESRATDKPAKIRRPFTLVEKICSAAGIAIVIGTVVWLIAAIVSEADGRSAASTPWPDLPMKGSLVTISEASTSWRKRKDNDRVGQMDVVLPVPGQQMPEIIPQVVFTIDSGKSSSGFLRFIFKDSEGKSRGDTRVVQVENGKLKDMGKGEIIRGDTEGAAYGSSNLPYSPQWPTATTSTKRTFLARTSGRKGAEKTADGVHSVAS